MEDKTIKFIFAATIFLTLLSCDNDSHVRVYRLPKKAEAIQQATVPEIIEDFKLSWEKPHLWLEVSGHAMRLASFSAPFKQGNADVSITSFPGKSGGVISNVNRWLNQIGLGNMTDRQINDLKLEKLGNLGTYSYFKLLNQSNTESAILAAIYQTEGRTVFLKLSASLDGAEELESEFLEFCESIALSK